MEFGVLGPLEVTHDDREVEISAGRHRALLAALLLRANQVVSTEKLAGRIWDDRPPRDSRATTQTYVRRLRSALGDGLVDTRPGGYLISVTPEQLDLARFDHLLQQARQTNQPEQEAGLLAEALRLWRGPALTNVPSDALHRDEVPALTERRLWAVERRVDLDLLAGRQDGLVSELRGLVSEHPLRERFWAQLMTALVGSGRPAEALQAYEALRHRLGEELGTDPGTELRDLHRAILRGNPVPATPVAPEPVPAKPVPARPIPPAQLPPDVSAFTGRAAALRQLDGWLPAEPDRTNAVVVAAIEGTAGIGK
ncbi:MAG: SARP family transcriptional regulator, partial [Micromonosporaceae bacterium]|nr:SARP family transcriptional regulator [Micromonosporaceae bacterium]